MRYNDAKWNRDHRCIEGQHGFVARRVTSLMTSGQAMPLELLSMEALSTV
jgi:hypothetical protein